MDTLFDFAEPEHTTEFADAVCRPVGTATAARIVRDHHYLHRVPGIMWPLGYYLDGQIAGVITLSKMPGPTSRAACGDTYGSQCYELSRLFMFDWAGKNAESSFMGAAFKWWTQRAKGEGGWVLASWADTAVGHTGTVYQATNWAYTGPSKSPKLLDVDGNEVTSRNARHPRDGARSGQAIHVRIDAPIKHRYVTFLGTKRQKRELRAALRWPVLPYPK